MANRYVTEAERLGASRRNKGYEERQRALGRRKLQLWLTDGERAAVRLFVEKVRSGHPTANLLQEP